MSDTVTAGSGEPAPMPAAPFGRLLTAMVTPMTSDGAVDYAGAARLAEYLVTDMRNDGLVISGTTGESPTTSDTEKDRLLRTVIDAVGDRATVVAGVGTNDTHHTCELARQAEQAGADGLLVVTPYYNKPPQNGLVAHFAKAATKLAFYSGDDILNLPWLSVGAVGFVSVHAHVVGDRLHEMIDAYLAGDVSAALRHHRDLLPVFTGMMRTQGVITTKAALAMLGRPGGPVRPPMADATPAEVERLRADLVAGGVKLR
jgi:4-hydroxy-tetrahydrodipicolinate synthase